jgi:hypothetical protein
MRKGSLEEITVEQFNNRMNLEISKLNSEATGSYLLGTFGLALAYVTIKTSGDSSLLLYLGLPVPTLVSLAGGINGIVTHSASIFGSYILRAPNNLQEDFANDVLKSTIIDQDSA